MRDCEDGEMRDLLPGYVHGTLSAAERATVQAHIETCEDCAAEIALIQSASTAFPAPKIDIGKIVKALPPPPRAARSPMFASNFAKLAAAIALVAIGGFTVVAVTQWFEYNPVVVGSRTLASTPQSKPAAPVVADTTSVAAAPSTAVTPATATTGAQAVHAKGISFGGGLGDLSDDQLSALLAELDTIEALPSAEPESHLSPIVPEADGGHNAR